MRFTTASIGRHKYIVDTTCTSQQTLGKFMCRTLLMLRRSFNGHNPRT